MKYFFWLVLSCFHFSVMAEPLEIVFWHSMAGKLGEELTKITHEFNQSQANYTIKPVYKGDYLESLTSFAASFRAKQPPAMIQVFEVGTATMLASSGVIQPIDALMQAQGVLLPKKDFFPAVVAQYSRNGQLMAMPFNISLPVIFYNADILARFGYDATNFPTSWDELERLAKQLVTAGYPCAYASAYPAWVLMESFSSIHDLPMMHASTANAYQNNAAMIAHLERLARWQRLHYYSYVGRTDEATSLFIGKKCALFSQSSGVSGSLNALVSFRVGMAPMPLDTKVSTVRYRNVVGGAAIWVVAGQSSRAQQGIAKFLSYLARPNIQKQWHENTGYLPIGISGVYQETFANHRQPVLTLAQQEWMHTQVAEHFSRQEVQNSIRHVNEEELEAIFSGMKSAKEAMDVAVSRTRFILARFQKNQIATRGS